MAVLLTIFLLKICLTGCHVACAYSHFFTDQRNHTHTHTHTQASYLSTAWEHLLVMVVVVYNLIV